MGGHVSLLSHVCFVHRFNYLPASEAKAGNWPGAKFIFAQLEPEPETEMEPEPEPDWEPEPEPQPLAGDPSQSPEVIDFATYLGMDPVADRDLLWIAQRGLFATLPDGWAEHEEYARSHPSATGVGPTNSLPSVDAVLTATSIGSTNRRRRVCGSTHWTKASGNCTPNTRGRSNCLSLSLSSPRLEAGGEQEAT